MPRYVYDFASGGKDLMDLLGGKGANLAEMTNLGLPVPPGFTITTEACRAYLTGGTEPPELHDEVMAHLEALEKRMGRRLGQPDDPLLVSVRSGAKFSMPGMMDTILNIGLNDASVAALAERSGDERFAWDSYRRLIQMFSTTVLGVDGELFESALEQAKRTKGVTGDLDLEADDLRTLAETFKHVIIDRAGRPMPQDPVEQLNLAIRAVFASWSGERAWVYRRQEHIPEDLGTAVNVMTMVFGNLGEDSGTGVAFTRDPGTGRPGLYGDYLTDAQGEDVVAGIRDTVPLQELGEINPQAYGELLAIMETLENHYRDLCDIEFTIEHGRLWMLQTRVGKRTAAAAFRIAAQLAEQGLIDADEALRRVSGAQLAQLMFPRFDTAAAAEPIARGVNASPGAAVGRAVFDSGTAVRRARAGERVILVRHETNPDDLEGMIAAEGVLTGRGGKTSHAAVVARGMGKTCVCGVETLTVDLAGRRFAADGGVVIEEGDVISIDGSSGAVYRGVVPVVPSAVVEYFEGRSLPHGAAGLVTAVDRIMTHADKRRRMKVRANADTPADAERARRFGAAGIGLCRTEHMFLGDRRPLVERLILAATPKERQAALDGLLPLQRKDFAEILRAMDGLPVTIRLIDPPLHEFLPDVTELSVRVALAEERGRPDAEQIRLLGAVRRLHEQNPMLGLRGVRLGLVVPGLFAMQVRAVGEAVAERRMAGGDPQAEIMIPLVGALAELRIVAEESREVLARVAAETGVDVGCPIGTMIELPRAALTAGRLAREARFFSFGTNDLTQTTWGFSRDDVEGAFFAPYLDKGIFETSPFETLDLEGVGRLVEIAVREGRATRPDLALGVCGEHGGEPASVRFSPTVTTGSARTCSPPWRWPAGPRPHAWRSATGSSSCTARTIRRGSPRPSPVPCREWSVSSVTGDRLRSAGDEDGHPVRRSHAARRRAAPVAERRARPPRRRPRRASRPWPGHPLPGRSPERPIPPRDRSVRRDAWRARPPATPPTRPGVRGSRHGRACRPRRARRPRMRPGGPEPNGPESPGGRSAGQDDLERAGLARVGEHLIRLDEVLHGEVMGHEPAGIDLVAGDQAEKGRCRVGVDQAGADGDVPDPLRFQVQRGRFTVDADVGDVPAGTHQPDGELERCRRPDGLDGDVCAQTTGEGLDDTERVLAAVVHRDVRAELLRRLEPAVGEVDGDDVAGAEQTRSHDGGQADGAGADDRDDVAGTYLSVEDADLVAGRQDVRQHEDLLIGGFRGRNGTSRER